MEQMKQGEVLLCLDELCQKNQSKAVSFLNIFNSY